MKQTMSPARAGRLLAVQKISDRSDAATTQRFDAGKNPPDVLTRIKLAFLDDYTCEKQGYDPYDTCRNRATPDIWVNKRKRG